MRRPWLALVAAGCASALPIVVGCHRAEGAAPAVLALTIRVDDTLAFHPNRIECRPGQVIRLRLANAIPAGGPELPHNLVLFQPGTDVEAFGQAAVAAEPQHGYIPDGYTTAVLFASELVQPSRQVEITLRAPERSGVYPFACSFPGHCLMGMTGQLVVN